MCVCTETVIADCLCECTSSDVRICVPAHHHHHHHRCCCCISRTSSTGMRLYSAHRTRLIKVRHSGGAHTRVRHVQCRGADTHIVCVAYLTSVCWTWCSMMFSDNGTEMLRIALHANVWCKSTHIRCSRGRVRVCVTL